MKNTILGLMVLGVAVAGCVAEPAQVAEQAQIQASLEESVVFRVDDRVLAQIVLEPESRLQARVDEMLLDNAFQLVEPDRCTAHEQLAVLELHVSETSTYVGAFCATEIEVAQSLDIIREEAVTHQDDAPESYAAMQSERSPKSRACWGWCLGCRAGSNYSCCRLGGGSHMLCNFWFGY